MVEDAAPVFPAAVRGAVAAMAATEMVAAVERVAGEATLPAPMSDAPVGLTAVGFPPVVFAPVLFAAVVTVCSVPVVCEMMHLSGCVLASQAEVALATKT